MKKLLLFAVLMTAMIATTLQAQKVTKLESGTSYQVLKEGRGDSPALGQEVEMRFKMMDAEGNVQMTSETMGGTVFQTMKKGENPMEEEQMTILKTMKKGSRYLIKVPKANIPDEGLQSLPGDFVQYEVEMVNFGEAPPNGVDFLRDKIKADGIVAGIETYHEIQRSNPKGYVFREWDMNMLGYKLLQEEKMDEAVAVFKLNVEAHPKSANVHDSLGDAYLAKGDKVKARESFQKALKIDRNFKASAEKLQALENE